MPDLVIKPALNALSRTSKEVEYLARERICDESLLDGFHVMTEDIWLGIEYYFKPLILSIEVGSQHLDDGIGVFFFLLQVWFLPNAQLLSSSSSLSTEVITQCFNPISFMEWAIFLGSSSSNGKGFPVWVAQNLHERVQISPAIIKVAVPFVQHSPMFGHFPLEQMVCNWFNSTIFFTFV